MEAARIHTPIASMLSEQEIQIDGLHRSAGVHVTDLVSLVIKAIDPTLYTKEYSQETRETWLQSGFLWERVLARVFTPAQALRCHEIRKDGVSGSPDWIEHDPDLDYICPGESKFTWKSARGFDTPTPAAGLDQLKFLGWKLQMLAYSYMLSVEYMRLHVFFVNGEYDKYIPDPRSYRLKFSLREQQENWAMLLSHGRKAGLL